MKTDNQTTQPQSEDEKRDESFLIGLGVGQKKGLDHPRKMKVNGETIHYTFRNIKAIEKLLNETVKLAADLESRNAELEVKNARLLAINYQLCADQKAKLAAQPASSNVIEMKPKKPRVRLPVGAKSFSRGGMLFVRAKELIEERKRVHGASTRTSNVLASLVGENEAIRAAVVKQGVGNSIYLPANLLDEARGKIDSRIARGFVQRGVA